MTILSIPLHIRDDEKKEPLAIVVGGPNARYASRGTRGG